MKKFIHNYKGLPRGVYVICFATLINRLGDFVVPFLSLYLTQKIGLTAGTSGILVTLATLIAIPASFIGGKISDMYGRKKIYLFSQSISAFTLIPCAFTKNPVITLVCLFISTFFNGFVRPSFDSMITDMLTNDQRQIGFSLKYLSINVGVSIGPIIAGFLFNNLLPVLFLGDAFTSLIAVILIWKNIQETHTAGSTVRVESIAEKEESGNLFLMFYKRPHLLLFFILNGAYSFVYNQMRFSLPITMNYLFHYDGANLFGYLMSINAITVLALTAFISVLTRKNHQLTNMVFSGILYAVGFGMIGYVNHFISLILSTIIWSTGEILSSISSGVYLANNSPSNYRARLNALMSISHSVGASLCTMFSGVYIQYHDCRTIWPIIFFISLIASFFMFGLRKYSGKMANKYESVTET